MTQSLDKKIKNIPDKIYLQVGLENEIDDNINFKKLSGVSWCEDKIHKDDIEYILALKAQSIIEERDELKKALAEMTGEYLKNTRERDRYKQALEKITSIEEDYMDAFNIASEALTNPQTTKP